MDGAGRTGEPLPLTRSARLATLLALTLLGPVGSAHGAVSRPPRLATLLGRARVAVVGDVTRVDTYDAGRVTVARVRPDRTLKGDPGPGELPVVEEHDRPSSTALLRAGDHVVVFLQRAERTSALAHALPPGPTYLRLVDGNAGLVGSTDAETIREAGALVGRLAEASMGTELDATVRAAAARTLVFDEIAARHPLVVADGAAGLASVADLSTDLTDAEHARLEHALQRRDLPSWVRITLVDATAGQHLTALVRTLQQLDGPTPELLAASWEALRQLGHTPTAKDLAAYALSPDPAIRAVVPTALVAAGGDDAIPSVEKMALTDADTKVRVAATEALGGTKRATVLPSLEKIFRTGPWDVRQAAARGFTLVDGRGAAESLSRLAFEGETDAQHYAVTILLALVSKDDPLVVRIRDTHPDPELRKFVEEGPYMGHSHKE